MKKTLCTFICLLLAVLLIFSGCSYSGSDSSITADDSNYEEYLDAYPVTEAEAADTPMQDDSFEEDEENLFEGCIEYYEAQNHVGEYVTVYGNVNSTYFAASSNGAPTFINIGAPYGDSTRCTAVIFDDDRAKFGSPEDTYRGKTIKVTGTVQIYSGAAQIIVRDPSQIEIVD